MWSATWTSTSIPSSHELRPTPSYLTMTNDRRVLRRHDLLRAAQGEGLVDLARAETVWSEPRKNWVRRNASLGTDINP